MNRCYKALCSFYKYDYYQLRHSHIIQRSTWSIFGAFFSRIVSLIVFFVAAKMLGSAKFGEFSIIYATILLISSSAGLSIGVTATRYVAKYSTTEKEKLGNVLGMLLLISICIGTVVITIVLSASQLISMVILGSNEYAKALSVSSPLVLLMILYNFQIGILYGLNKFKSIAEVGMIAGAIGLVIIYYSSKYMGLVGLLGGLGMYYAVSVILLQVKIYIILKNKNIKWLFKGAKKELSVIYYNSLPATMSSFVGIFALWLTQVIIIKQDGGNAEIGIYNAANLWLMLLVFMPTYVGKVLLPEYVEKTKNNQRKYIKSNIVKVYKAFTLSVGVPALLLSMVSPFAMQIYGNDYSDGWGVMVVLLATAIIMSYQVPLYTYIHSKGAFWIALKFNSIWGIIFVGFTCIMRNGGAMGLANARLVSYLIVTYIMYKWTANNLS